ncbi:serine threonine protein kinase : Probable serine/threonine-protein kinase OS=Blastopirellula marina DSM 3645 GN=DSM3645_09987 PE=3 SV=1: Pkinase [Gemmata massiliana]|uniref:Protein kinase domain-containing protein n=1 Tax=Gemmata massiliana TaxID=1210884 RepID=A0A6P2DBE5_9BACT|nr:serine threonine protein kinase : Probable serine/threonine-protein kinase OS=Blastopirellula marina DSM 3645 GN=DSM3645_09987 PE=3 SV=1: Pkinase [Gemmata massiliana]
MSDSGLTPVMGETDREAARELSLRGVHPPAKVPGYDQEQFLGHGAYGEVWTAVSRNSGRRVAIKFFTRRGGLDWSALAREVEKLRYLFSDRYVVQLFEVGWESDPPYYVMEFMENGSLEDLLRAYRPTVHDAVTVFREVAIALVHAHDKGILHCDLKPANILLDHERKPRLADFGQSRLTNEVAPALGTLFYMAPEQADLSAAPDARWDVYALGAVMYRTLTGEPPHRNEPGATHVTTGTLDAQLAAYRKLIFSAPKPRAHRSVPGVDSGLAAIIDKCLEPSPSKRFANPQAVLAALDAWNLQRVRRPLLWVTGFTFVLLFCLMALLGQYLFRTTVNTAEHGVESRALDANRFAAQTEARQLGAQVQLRWVQLEAAARNQQLRELLQKGEQMKDDPGAGPKLDQLLAERKERGDKQFSDSEKASIWFADDAGGYQRGTSPPSEPSRHKYRGYRDYFNGTGEFPETASGTPPGIVTRPHRSVAYRRKQDTGGSVWAVAFTVPVMSDGPNPKPIGVVGMTIDLADAAPEDANRFSVLIDTRPDFKTGRRGLILRHPYWSATKGESDPPLYYADAVVKWADTMREAGSDTLPLKGGHEYTDPVAAGDDGVPGQAPYEGKWLASANRVRVGPDKVDTGWVVVVQERRDEVLQPVRNLQWRLGYVGLIACVVVLVLVALMWTGMVLVMDTSSRSPVTRLLRKWAGLPTSATSGATGTFARGSSLPGAGTARLGATITPGTDGPRTLR